MNELMPMRILLVALLLLLLRILSPSAAHAWGVVTTGYGPYHETNDPAIFDMRPVQNDERIEEESVDDSDKEEAE